MDILRSLCATLIDSIWTLVTETRTLTNRVSAGEVPFAGRLLEGKYPKEDQIQLGRSVVFLRNPVFVALERAREQRRSEIDSAALKVQKTYKGFAARNQVGQVKMGVVKVRTGGVLGCCYRTRLWPMSGCASRLLHDSCKRCIAASLRAVSSSTC